MRRPPSEADAQEHPGAMIGLSTHKVVMHTGVTEQDTFKYLRQREEVRFTIGCVRLCQN